MSSAIKFTVTCWHGREITCKPKYPGGHGTTFIHVSDGTSCSGKRRR